jgi:branched-chain amino acid transport system ATP-binding protein
MMSEPELVLLDEPAGGVNPALLERIGDRIKRLNARGITFLLVEHNMGFVMSMCTQVVVLHRGRPIASGQPDVVRRDPAVLDAYLGA